MSFRANQKGNYGIRKAKRVQAIKIILVVFIAIFDFFGVYLAKKEIINLATYER